MKDNKLQDLLNFLGTETKLIAVSKFRTTEEIMRLYNQGIRVFAENRVQSLLERVNELPGDIEWHLIGHLQRNKVKQVLPHVALTHSIDSLRLLKAVNDYGIQNNTTPSILLQVHIAKEDSKFGFDKNELIEHFANGEIQEYTNVNICGLMGMATFTEDKSQVKEEFEALNKLYTQLKKDHFGEQPNFKEISMGMSGDYKLAKDCGSTMVRIGSLLFSE